jgi:hypothetical protein
MKRHTLILCCIFILMVALLLISQVVLAQTGGGYDLSWNTLFSGGATIGGAYSMDSAIGQPFVGKTSGSPYELCAGYLCGVQSATRVYLPLVRK